MRSLVVKISFFEGFFKVHQTKTSRITYSIPLPTTVAGMFGSMLGIQRKDAYKTFRDCIFGAAFVDGKKFIECRENVTYLLFKKRIKGVETVSILHQPEYYIAVGGNKEKIEEFEKKIKNGVEFLPFGGQNDYFVKDWSVEGIGEIVNTNVISNYAPVSWIENIAENTILHIFPVIHNFPCQDENFIFILEGHVKVKKEFLNEIKITEINGKKIALYSLDKFKIIGEWNK